MFHTTAGKGWRPSYIPDYSFYPLTNRQVILVIPLEASPLQAVSGGTWIGYQRYTKSVG